ncbi:MAG: hypothetical protein ACKOCQ_07075 [Candidatus Nitrosotenuis sp.]
MGPNPTRGFNDQKLFFRGFNIDFKFFGKTFPPFVNLFCHAPRKISWNGPL